MSDPAAGAVASKLARVEDAGRRFTRAFEFLPPSCSPVIKDNDMVDKILKLKARAVRDALELLSEIEAEIDKSKFKVDKERDDHLCAAKKLVLEAERAFKAALKAAKDINYETDFYRLELRIKGKGTYRDYL